MYPKITEVFPGATVKDWVISAAPGWVSFNPSIAYSPVEGYRMIVRTSNYVMMPEESLYYVIRDPDNIIRTINRFCVLDSDLDIISMEAIDDSAVRHVEWPMVQGMEDARLYWNSDGRWHAYGTLREHRWDGNCEIAEDVLDGTVAINRQVYPNPEQGRTQKNWTILGEGDEGFIYTCSPPALYRDGKVITDTRSLHPRVGDFRGGTQAIRYRDGFLSAIHSVTWLDDPRPRRYWHFFVKYDAQGFVTHFSPGFYYLEEGIEFAAGIVLHGGDVVTSVGSKDYRTLRAHVPIEELESSWIDAVA